MKHHPNGRFSIDDEGRIVIHDSPEARVFFTLLMQIADRVGPFDDELPPDETADAFSSAPAVDGA